MLETHSQKSLFQNLAIQSKITVVTMLASFAAVIISAVFFGVINVKQMKLGLIENINIFTRQLAAEEQAAIHFNKEDIAKEILSTFRSQYYIKQIWVINNTEDVLAMVSSDPSLPSVLPAFEDIELDKITSNRPHYEFHANIVNYLQPVIVDHQIIGAVVVQAKLTGLYGEYFQYFLVALMNILILAVISYFLGRRLSGTISEPIIELLDEMKIIARERDYTRSIKHYYQDEIGDLIDGFNSMLSDIENHSKQIKTKNKHLEQFAFATSHDLKEPLRKIGLFADLLRNDCYDAISDESKKYINIIEETVARMKNLLEGLLVYAQAAGGQGKREQIDLQTLTQAIVSECQRTLEITSGEISILGKMPTIIGDKSQIHCLLHNLINNGLRFHKPDVAPQIKIQARFLDKSESTRAKALKVCRITISDNGIGIESKHLERIFDVFERLNKRDEFSGSGIGLGVSKQIVEQHNGCLEVTSEHGVGSKFIVDLPAE